MARHYATNRWINVYDVGRGTEWFGIFRKCLAWGMLGVRYLIRVSPPSSATIPASGWGAAFWFVRRAIPPLQVGEEAEASWVVEGVAYLARE